MLALGAGSIAVNAVKGMLGSDKDASHVESSSKHDTHASTKGNEEEISKALDSLRKSGDVLLRLNTCVILELDAF